VDVGAHAGAESGLAPPAVPEDGEASSKDWLTLGFADRYSPIVSVSLAKLFREASGSSMIVAPVAGLFT
jgi:hypothetical protein